MTEKNLCKICGGERKKIFSKKILGKYNTDYFECLQCGFVQTGKPYWLDEAYSKAITSTDVGLINRNVTFSDIIEKVINKSFNRYGKFLDFAGGYGILTRIMRDKGFDFYHEDRYCENIFARYFEIRDLPEQERRFEIITSFEMMEHMEDPFKELDYIFSITNSLLFSTEIIPDRDFENWWYLGTEHGQHISFYTPRSLEIVAKKYGKQYYPHGHLHLISDKKDLKPFDISEKTEVSKKMQSKTFSDFEMIREKIENHA